MVFGNEQIFGSSGKGFYDYEIQNSLRIDYDTGDNNYLSGPSLSSASDTPFTFSLWLKRSAVSDFGASDNANFLGVGNGNWYAGFKDDDTIRVLTGTGAGAELSNSNTAFSDPTSWYHIHCTASSTASERKIHINGVELPLTTSAWGSAGMFVNGQSIEVGASSSTNSGQNICPGLYAEVYGFYDRIIDYTNFGEFKQGIWIPKKYSSFTNSRDFYLEFKNSANLGLDSSGNGNNFTVNNIGTDHQTTDTPTFR